MIPRDDIIAGIVSTPISAFLLELEEIKPSPRVKSLIDFFVDIGVLQKKWDKYRKGGRVSPQELSPLAEAVSTLFQQLIFPYLILGKKFDRINQDIQRALYIYTSAFQTMRITIVQELLKYGGLTLVAGWFPCGFSSELMSIAGRDLVIVEERDDIIALEIDRLSLIPLATAPIGRELAAASFYAFENMSLEKLGEISEKYGKFETAIVCQRGADLALLQNVANEIYYIIPRDKIVTFLNNALIDALGLSNYKGSTFKNAERQEIGPFDVYILRGTSVS
ncbi:conserved hypothetical protein [Pyrobaculum islandicum DSM 4184]|uniref:Uncharacterized protein n=1 Tax=Pyrobaculum islandicum (strain DSM 4184 / JCM 9189 / GEO3) TaxID=384616 RepID=A1RSN1_PYRIL|nr:hypothetical protein [Pyrobaculum islandicum]ABL87963.1 conserved hypothetical protein [Pyrobaculum islandicum DSM 4184]